MGFKIREMHAEGKFSQVLTVEALSRTIPQDTIRAVLQQTTAGKTRERKLTLPVVVWLVIALHIYTTQPISAVLAKLARGLRFLWPDPLLALPQDSALTRAPVSIGSPSLGSAVPLHLPPDRHPPHAWGVSLWLALDGARWHPRRCA
jgi:hypothetical protein